MAKRKRKESAIQNAPTDLTPLKQKKISASSEKQLVMSRDFVKDQLNAFLHASGTSHKNIVDFELTSEGMVCKVN